MSCLHQHAKDDSGKRLDGSPKRMGDTFIGTNGRFREAAWDR